LSLTSDRIFRSAISAIPNPLCICIFRRHSPFGCSPAKPPLRCRRHRSLPDKLVGKNAGSRNHDTRLAESSERISERTRVLLQSPELSFVTFSCCSQSRIVSRGNAEFWVNWLKIQEGFIPEAITSSSTSEWSANRNLSTGRIVGFPDR
jgi:hypothetical protein